MGPDLTSHQRRARRWRDVKSGPWAITGNLDRTFASAASKADILSGAFPAGPDRFVAQPHNQPLIIWKTDLNVVLGAY